MAFSMAASVFVAPNAFAAYNSTTPLTATVDTVFLEKNANGVYEEYNDNDAGDIAEVAYKDSAGNDIDDADKATGDSPNKKGSFIIGEDYTVTITQTADEAALYTINSAKIGVDLDTGENDGSAYYNEYVKDVTLTKTFSGADTVYTGSFKAFGEANKAVATGSNDKYSSMFLYIDCETNASTVTAVAGTSTKAEVTPLDTDADGELKEVDSIVLKAGQHAYFKVTANDGYYIKDGNVKAYAYEDGLTTSADNDTLTLDASKGLDIYKLDADDVGALITAAGDEGTVKVVATAVASSNAYTLTTSGLASRYKITTAEGETVSSGTQIYEGTKLTVTDSKGGYIYGITSDSDDLEAYYPGKSSASFIMPGEDLEITAIVSNVTSQTSLTLENGNAYISGGTVSAATGSVKQVTFKPTSGTIYPDVTNPVIYDIDYDDDDWKFDFLGVKDGNLVYDVTFGTKSLELGFATDKEGLRHPSVTSRFVPALEFEQMVYNNGAYINLASIGTNGVVTVGTSATVTVNFDSASVTMDYINLAGTEVAASKLTYDDNNADKASAAFTVTKAVDDNNKGLLLNFDADYKLGNIEIDETDNGTLIATTGYASKTPVYRAKAGALLYLTATPNTGYKLDSITVKENVLNGKTLTLTKLTDNVYTVKMPTTNTSSASGINKDYGISVTAKATFVKDSSVVLVNNLVPEADKATNNGYAEASFGTASQIKVGEEFTVEYIANDNCKLLSTAVQYTNTSGKTVTLEATKVDENKYTYKAPSNVEDAISIGAKFAKTSDIIKVENKTVEADKETNNGYLTINETEVVAGGTINGTATAVEGYEVESVSYSYTNSDKKTVTKDVTVEENAFAITVPDDVVADGTISVSAKFAKSETEDSDKNAWTEEDDNWTYWKDGKQVTGWFQDGGTDWFYADVNTGVMKTGWFQDGGNEWFYADVKTGAMKTGWFKDGGDEWYYCFTATDAALRGNRAGVMATNQWISTDNVTWYYVNKAGIMETSKWVSTDDVTWYYVNRAGVMETNKWVRDNDDNVWSFVGENGAFTGEQKSSI